MHSAADAGGDLDRRPMGAAGWLARAAQWLLALALAALAFTLRALTWPAVFTAAGVRLVGPDAHYHLRRVLWSVENFPHVLTRDAYVRFPLGGQPIWTPAFDWTIAALARGIVGRGDPAGVERLAVWIPPLLGTATVVALFGLAARHFGRRTGFVAAAILCVLPPHVGYSQVGFVDHHAAVALFAAGLLGACLALASPRRHPPRQEGGLALAGGLGLLLGGALLLWPGCLLHVAIVQSWLVARVAVAAWTRSDAREAADRAAVAAFVQGVAFLLVAPFALGNAWDVWGDLSPIVLSDFQPLWLGLPTVGLGACALVWRGRGAGSSRAARIALLAGALLLPGLASLAVPGVREGLQAAWAWLFRGEAFQAVVGESLPLLWDGQGVSLRRANAALTPLVYLLPVLLALQLTARRQREAHRFVAWYAVVLFGATLAQYRFANCFSVVYALLVACSLERWLAIVRERTGGLRVALRAATALALLALALPLANAQLRTLATAQRAFAGETVMAREPVAHHAALVETARWLGAHSPATSGWLSPGAPPSYGVLTAWGDGHVVRYVAQRPVVQDNFGDDVGREGFDGAERYFAATSEDDALGVVAALGVRYVVVRHSGSGHAPAPYDARSMLVRLEKLRGSAGSVQPGPTSGAPVFDPALTRHRLLYESHPQETDAAAAGRFKLYEIVKGAAVAGRASPGEVVEARILLQAGASSFEYRCRDRAGPDGRYRLRLPYPSEPFEGEFQPAGPWAIRSGGRVAALRITEPEVREGRRLEGPDLAS